MYDGVITLISEVKTKNKYGDMISKRAEREVFAEQKSITQSEFYQAQAAGLKPEIKFEIADYMDYHNEKILRFQAFHELEPSEYSIIRTYRKNNQLEIVCKKGGE